MIGGYQTGFPEVVGDDLYLVQSFGRSVPPLDRFPAPDGVAQSVNFFL
jgi:hypothetical protein